MVIHIGQAYFQHGLKDAEGRNPHPLTKEASKLQTPDANIRSGLAFILETPPRHSSPAAGFSLFRQTGRFRGGQDADVLQCPLRSNPQRGKTSQAAASRVAKFDLVINLK